MHFCDCRLYHQMYITQMYVNYINEMRLQNSFNCKFYKPKCCNEQCFGAVILFCSE